MFTITSGDGSLSKQVVTLDGYGRATVGLTGTANGCITVSAAVPAGGTVVRLETPT